MMTHDEAIREFEKHEPDLRSYLLRSLWPDEAAADDAAQDVFLRFYRASRNREIPNAKGFLFTIAHHQAIDIHKAKKRRARSLDDAPDTVCDKTPPPFLEALDTPKVREAVQAELGSEDGQTLLAYFAALASPEKNAVADLAQALAIPRGTLSSAVSRWLAHLRDSKSRILQGLTPAITVYVLIKEQSAAAAPEPWLTQRQVFAELLDRMEEPLKCAFASVGHHYEIDGRTAASSDPTLHSVFRDPRRWFGASLANGLTNCENTSAQN